MNPSPQAIAALKAAFATLLSGSDTDAQAAAAINATTVANQVARGQVPNPIGEPLLIPLLNDPNNGSVAKILNWVNYGELRADIQAANRGGLLIWAQKLTILGLITAGEATAITGYLNGTTADPTWTAQVPWPIANLGRLVDAADINATRSS